MRNSKVSQWILSTKPPVVCPKPYCGGTFFIPHEDGWQCFNCMKIIYRKQPIINSNNPKRIGYHKNSSYPFLESLRIS